MAPSEFAAMETSELHDKLVESRKELFNLRFQKATGQLDNTARLGRVRKDVARILTVLRQQELGIEPEPAADLAVAPAARSRRAETGEDVPREDDGPADELAKDDQDDKEEA